MKIILSLSTSLSFCFVLFRTFPAQACVDLSGLFEFKHQCQQSNYSIKELAMPIDDTTVGLEFKEFKDTADSKKSTFVADQIAIRQKGCHTLSLAYDRRVFRKELEKYPDMPNRDVPIQYFEIDVDTDDNKILWSHSEGDFVSRLKESMKMSLLENGDIEIDFKYKRTSRISGKIDIKNTCIIRRIQ